MQTTRLVAALLIVLMQLAAGFLSDVMGQTGGQEPALQTEPAATLRRYSSQSVVCLDLGEACQFKLKNGTAKSIQLKSVPEFRDSVIGLVRRADVRVAIDGQPLDLVCAPYVMPTEVDGIGWDHADWGEAKVLLQDGREVWLSDLPVRESQTERFSTAPLFSFVYGGQPASELLAQWQLERSSRQLNPQRKERKLIWTDAQTGLHIRCVGVEYADFPTVEWTIYFKNTGTNDTPVVSDIQALDLDLLRPPESEFILHHHTADAGWLRTTCRGPGESWLQPITAAASAIYDRGPPKRLSSSTAGGAKASDSIIGSLTPAGMCIRTGGGTPARGK